MAEGLRPTNNDVRSWSRAISSIGGIVWDELFAPIYARLEWVGPTLTGAPVTLLPAAGLSLLPLHACWREEDGVTRYLAEEYTISYCPSAMALASSSEKLKRREGGEKAASKSLLVVANPTNDLPFATLEGEAVAAPGRFRADAAALRGQGFVERSWPPLRGSRLCSFCVSRQIRSHISNALVPGFGSACGAARRFRFGAPQRTNGHMGQRDAPSYAFSVRNGRVADIARAPSEFTGLSSGWLRTGAIAVISSLWSVDDLCTMLLMERLYQSLFPSADDPARVEMQPDTALRAAQLWLKRLTCEEVDERLADLQRKKDLTAELRLTIDDRREEFGSRPGSSKPFSQPYWWAGFLCSGV